MLEIISDFPLNTISTFKVGGVARYFARPSSIDELREALVWARSHNVPYRALGGGSNILVSDSGFDGLIIVYADKTITIDESRGTVLVGAGAVTAVVAGATVSAGLTGFEWAVGVPGTIGGAIYGNAGASGAEMKDAVVFVSVFEQDEVRVYTRDECEFRYRHSCFKHKDVIILGAQLQLQRATDPNQPREEMKRVLQYRNETQPKGLASSGCTFKNYECADHEIDELRLRGVPEEFLQRHRIPTGWLIEHAGLKGEREGGASVSSVHGNFIVTEPHTSSQDIMSLITRIKHRVHEVFGVFIEEEITIL